MEIEHEREEKGGWFLATEGGVEIGEVSYYDGESNVIFIDHVGVNPRFRGQGIGREMVIHIVDYCRNEDKKIVPVCPFAVGVFNSDPSISDVLNDY